MLFPRPNTLLCFLRPQPATLLSLPLRSFIFTCLKPDDPNRQCSFVLQVDYDDKYEVASCEPSVDAAVVRDVTERLNQADDMSYLVHRMRKFWRSSFPPLIRFQISSCIIRCRRRVQGDPLAWFLVQECWDWA
jgi:Chromosome segregation protein Spc25